MRVDDKDKLIIEELKRNSRTSIRDIAKITGSKPSTVHQRIKKYCNTGLIENFTVKLNNKLANENFIVFMLVTTEKKTRPELFNDSHIKEVFSITGEQDLFLKLKFKDVEEYNDFLSNFKQKTGIQKVITIVATKTIKEEI